MTSTFNSTVSQIILLPGSLLLLMIIGCILLAARRRRSGWTLLVLGIGSLAVFSMPVTAYMMIRSLEPAAAVDPQQLDKVQAIVLLSGGLRHSQPEYASDVYNSATLERVRYAAFLHTQHNLPIMVTGGNPSGGEAEGWVMKRELETVFNVPVRWQETESTNTAENAEFARRVLQPQGVDTIALITHAWHMPRARKAFERAGFTVIAAPTVFHIEPVLGIMNFIPQADYLSLSNKALHEWVGMIWYRLPR